MAMERYSLDTNILVYSVDRDAGEKHRIAAALLDVLVDRDCVLSLQALAEFFHVVTRKGRVSAAMAHEIVADWSLLFPLVSADGKALNSAMNWMENGVFSFWDGLLVATVSHAGVTRLFSEDMQHAFEIGGCTLINPFAPTVADDPLSPHFSPGGEVIAQDF